ncbi:hypothetical protein ACA910_011327 [Epithemia clementina (nom. ined.)]
MPSNELTSSEDEQIWESCDEWEQLDDGLETTTEIFIIHHPCDPATEIFEVCQSDPVCLEDLRRLVDTDPSLLRICDGRGNRPIFYLGRDRHIPTDVLEYVAQTSPDVLQIVPHSSALTTLLEAFANGTKLNLLKTLIAETPSIAQSEEWLGMDPLHETIMRGNADDDVILYLIESFPEAVERGNWEGRLPLHLACLHACSLDVVRVLAERYPTALELPDVDGDRALHMSVCCERSGEKGSTKLRFNLDIVRYLIERNPEALTQGNDEQQLPLHVACASGAGLDCIELLCTASLESVERLCGSGLYPLHCACTRKNYSEVILYLADLFHDAVRHKDEDGDLPLHILLRRDWPNAETEQLRVVDRFLSIYPEGIRALNEEDDLPLHIACESSKSLVLVKKLVDVWDENGGTLFGDTENGSVAYYGDNGTLPLHRACMKRKKRLDIIEYIVDAYPEAVDQPDDEGNFPLHFLLNGSWRSDEESRRGDLVRTMIQLFPDSVERTDENDISAFSLACRWHAPPGIVEVLRGDRSALHRAVGESACFATITRVAALYPNSIYEPNESGELPLHAACRRGLPIAIIKALYSRFPCAISMREENGNMPLHLACTNPSTQTLFFLLSKYKAALRMPNFRGALPLHLICSAPSVFLGDVRLVAERNLDALKRPDCNGHLPIHRYCGRPNTSTVLLYLVNENPSSCCVKDSEGNLPLHIVAQNRSCYQLAIQNLVKKNRQALIVRNAQGFLPLHLYLLHRYQHDIAHVKCLAQRGFSGTSLEAQTSAEGSTFLHAACESQASIEVVRYLLDRDTKDACKIRDAHGRLPLHLAQDYVTSNSIFSKYPDAIKSRDNQGNNPLHLACLRAKSLEVIRCLWVCDDESTMVKNDQGDLALHLACQARADKDVLDFLISAYPASVRARGCDGQLPLHAWFRDAPSFDCSGMDDEALKFVLAKYPNALQTVDAHGLFPAHLAATANVDLDTILQLLTSCPSIFA